MSSLDRYLRLMWRAQLTAESVLTLEEAAEALPGRDSEASAWLHENVVTQTRCSWSDEQLYRWGDILKAMSTKGASESTLSSDPISTWRGVATVLGVSEDTVARHRAKYNDQTTRPWFRDADEVAEWWRKMHHPPALRRTANGQGRQC